MVLTFEQAFGPGGQGAATAAAVQPMSFEDPTGQEAAAAPAPQPQAPNSQPQAPNSQPQAPNSQPQVMRFENFFQQQAQPQGDSQMGGTGLPAGQRPPAGQTVQSQVPRPPTQQGPDGPDDLSLASQYNSWLQKAGSFLDQIAPGSTKDIGGSGLHLSDISGPLSLASGIAHDNIGQAIGGGLQLFGTAARLAEMPGLSNAVQSLGGPLSLAMGIQSGDPMSIAAGLLGTYQAVNGIISSLGGAAMPSAATALASFAPEMAAAIANIFGGGVSATASMGTSALSAALSASLAGVAAGAAPVIQGITLYFQNKEEMDARNSGWWNNPIKGALFTKATTGGAQVNALLDQIYAGGVDKAPTAALTQALPKLVNGLIGYFETAQGGRGAIRASDSVTGGSGPMKSKSQGQEAIAKFEGDRQRAMERLVGVVQNLLDRGVTYEELGKLPISGDWAQENLDAGNRPHDMLAQSPKASQYMQEGAALFGKLDLNPQAEYGGGGEGGWSQAYQKNATEQKDELLKMALGSSTFSKASNSKTSQLMTDMYGGPLWAAFARMGIGGKIGDMIAERFDPWVHLRNRPAPDKAAKVAAQAQADPFYASAIAAGISPEYAGLIAGQMSQDFSSGGG